MSPAHLGPDPKTLLHTNDPKILDLLRALGVPDPVDCRRVIVDVRVGDVVRVYVERFARGVDATAILELDVVLDVMELGAV